MTLCSVIPVTFPGVPEPLEPLDEGISLANSFTNSVVNSCLICAFAEFKSSLTLVLILESNPSVCNLALTLVSIIVSILLISVCKRFNLLFVSNISFNVFSLNKSNFSTSNFVAKSAELRILDVSKKYSLSVISFCPP